MLLAEIEDHYRVIGRDCIADLGINDFTIVCKKYYSPTIDLGNKLTVSTNSNHDIEEDKEEGDENINLNGSAATANTHYNTVAVVAAMDHN